METYKVWSDHQLIGEHPAGSVHEGDVDTGLVVVEPDGSRHEYGPGKAHVAGYGAICGFMVPNPDCPNCGSVT